MKTFIPRSLLERAKKYWLVARGRERIIHSDISLRRIRHGSYYGGWWICPDGIGKDSVVYSVGIGNDISFDLALIEHYGSRVFAFDPTPESINWVKSQVFPDQFCFYECGLGEADGQMSMVPTTLKGCVSYTIANQQNPSAPGVQVPLNRIGTLMRRFGHDHIDILKMDIEGAEYDVIEEIVSGQIRVRQILVEFHHRFRGIGFTHTQKAIADLQNCGYRIFSVSPSGKEVSFLHVGR